jgi:hypothetical protein
MSSISDRDTAPTIILSSRLLTASEATGRHLIALLYIVIVIVATIPFGCALSKPPEHEVVIKQVLSEGTEIPSTWSSVTVTETVANNWLKSFNDPTLETLVAEAIGNNQDLRQAAALVEMARQTVVVVGSKLYPQIGAPVGLGGTLSDTYANGSQPNDDAFHGSNYEYVSVFWEIDLWGRLRAQREASEAKYHATVLDYLYARQSLAATVAKSWYLAIETRQLLRLAEESVRIYKEFFDLVKFRRTAGKVADLDVAEARANLNTASSTLHASKGQYSEAQRNLERLLGRYHAAELAAARTFIPVPPPNDAFRRVCSWCRCRRFNDGWTRVRRRRRPHDTNCFFQLSRTWFARCSFGDSCPDDFFELFNRCSRRDFCPDAGSGHPDRYRFRLFRTSIVSAGRVASGRICCCRYGRLVCGDCAGTADGHRSGGGTHSKLRVAAGDNHHLFDSQYHRSNDRKQNNLRTASQEYA